MSCSQIRYSSSNIIPTYISTKDNHHSKTHQIGKKKFYLWGLVPREHVVYVDQELSDAGTLSASRVEVHEYQTGLDVFLTYISLGLYKSVHYKITTWGYRE
jgi:hypothetical protein